MNIHTRKRAIFMRSFDRRNAVSAQEPKRFALSAQRKLSVLLMVGIIILSAKECEMGPGGDGSKMPGGGDPGPVVNDPLAPTGPLSLASSMEVDTELSFSSTSFGSSLAFAGDLDGGGGTVLAVGADNIDAGRGAIYLLSYDDEGTLQSTKKIGNGVDETNGDATTENGLAPSLESDRFGTAIANAGNFYGDGNTVLAVGALSTESNKGAIYLLSFSTAGNLTSTKKIAHGLDETNGTAETSNTLAPSLANNDFFGISLALMRAILMVAAVPCWQWEHRAMILVETVGGSSIFCLSILAVTLLPTQRLIATPPTVLACKILMAWVMVV